MGDSNDFWLPEPVSTMAPEIDGLFYWVTWVSVILFVGVVAGMIFFAFKYRRRSADDLPGVVNENKLLEITWIVIPTILVLITFTWGFKSYIKLGVAPPQSYQIQTVGAQWLWNFTYPNGTTTTNELHVPVGRPVKLIMSSEDVIHSFFVPAFRVKHDVLPGRYTSLWFEATQTGEYDVFCTEYCGTQHAGMLAKVVVHTPEEFQEWLEGAGLPDDLPLPQLGEIVYQQQVCNTCHSLDGTPGVGPTMQGLFGSTETLASGETVEVDENYLRESILQPGAKIVAGYPNVMPATYANLDERQVNALIAFIKEQ